MNRTLRQVTRSILLFGVLTHAAPSFAQQRPVAPQSPTQNSARGQRGGPGVERATNIQFPTSDGWQPGQEPSRGGAQRLPPNQPPAQRAPHQPPAAAAPQPRMPFKLTPQEEASLDQILIAWERQSSTIKTYKCDFTRLEYGMPFDRTPLPRDTPLTEATGELKYSAPDKGMFRVDTILLYNTKKKDYDKGGPENLEHWVCDGRSIFQIDHKEKTRIERPLPPEMHGQAISDGPLPFVFGAKAATLKHRYWMRDITPKNAPSTIWLEAHPRYQADASNFKYVEVIIGRKDFMPQAIKMYSPAFDPSRGNENSTVFVFKNASFNGPLANLFGDFVEPPLPFGYKKIVVQPTAEQPAAGNLQTPRQSASSARAPSAPSKR